MTGASEDTKRAEVMKIARGRKVTENQTKEQQKR